MEQFVKFNRDMLLSCHTEHPSNVPTIPLQHQDKSHQWVLHGRTLLTFPLVMPWKKGMLSFGPPTTGPRFGLICVECVCHQRSPQFMKINVCTCIPFPACRKTFTYIKQSHWFSEVRSEKARKNTPWDTSALSPGGFPLVSFTTPCTCGRKSLTFNKRSPFVTVCTFGPQTSAALPALLLFNKKVLFVMIIPFCTDRLKIWTIFQQWCSVFWKPVVRFGSASVTGLVFSSVGERETGEYRITACPRGIHDLYSLLYGAYKVTEKLSWQIIQTVLSSQLRTWNCLLSGF